MLKSLWRVGDHVTWHTRPEVHVDHGGYLTTEPMTGVVQSVHDGFIMVGTGKFSRGWTWGRRGTYLVEHVLAVEEDNPSLKCLFRCSIRLDNV